MPHFQPRTTTFIDQAGSDSLDTWIYHLYNDKVYGTVLIGVFCKPSSSNEALAGGGRISNIPSLLGLLNFHIHQRSQF